MTLTVNKTYIKKECNGTVFRGVLHEDYSDISSYLFSIPDMFHNREGKLLHSGRNEIRILYLNGRTVVAKKYRRHNLFKRISYSFFRTNKAYRAYHNAALLRDNGVQTPHEIAYIEEWTYGLLVNVYYICNHTEAQPIRPNLIDKEPFDRPLAIAYARFVAQLHEKGILHKDLNPTNVLYTFANDKFNFEVIDINRMVFYENQPVPKADCMENLTLFWWLTDVYRFVLNEYARQRQWTLDDISEAVKVKQRHDRNWVRRKRFTSLFKHKH